MANEAIYVLAAASSTFFDMGSSSSVKIFKLSKFARARFDALNSTGKVTNWKMVEEP